MKGQCNVTIFLSGQSKTLEVIEVNIGVESNSESEPSKSVTAFLSINIKTVTCQ
jgi:hypothetical protein